MQTMVCAAPRLSRAFPPPLRSVEVALSRSGWFPWIEHADACLHEEDLSRPEPWLDAPPAFSRRTSRWIPRFSSEIPNTRAPVPSTLHFTACPQHLGHIFCPSFACLSSRFPHHAPVARRLSTSLPLTVPGERSRSAESALNRHLTAATSLDRLFDLITDNVTAFDAVNAATALHRLARVARDHDRVARQRVARQATLDHPTFQDLVFVAQSLLPRMSAQPLASVLWAYATLGYQPSAEERQELSDAVASAILPFNTSTQAIAMVVWAYGTMKIHPGDAARDALSTAIKATARRFRPPDIAMT